MVLMHQEKNEKLDIKLDIKRPVLPLWISFTQNIFFFPYKLKGKEFFQ